MSFCKSEGPDGKDQVIFLTEEDAKKPSNVELGEASKEDGPQGLITEDGEINWNCPCLGGMPVGPCGIEFREAFSCFHYSETEPKGADCIEKFQAMQDCMQQYPELYDNDKKEADTQQATAESEAAAATTSSQQPNSSSTTDSSESTASPSSSSSTAVAEASEPVSAVQS